MHPLRLFASAVVLTAALSGCATIMHGSKQDVGVSSMPTGATVRVDSQDLGRTPVVAKLKRKENHIVRVELDGYKPFEGTLTRTTSGWVWGNILFGGLIGLAVDASTGGLYKLTPEQVAAQLPSNTASLSRDGIYVVVTLQPGEGWTKVGQLERAPATSVATR
jgi:hypothetical protein